MFPSNLEYISDNASENDDKDLSETYDCIYRQCRSSDASTSDSKHCHLSCVSKGPVFLYFCIHTLFMQKECV